MEDVGAVLVNEHALAIIMIVTVSGDVVAFLKDQYGHPARGETLRRHATRQTRPNDNTIAETQATLQMQRYAPIILSARRIAGGT